MAAAVCGALVATPSPGPGARRHVQDPEWAVYKSPDESYEISYPAGWRVIVGVARDSSASAWEPMVLGEDELGKVTFYEAADSFWPGQYQLRLLANPAGLDLDQAYAEFDLSDLWLGSAADTVVGGVRAKTWVRWSFDSLRRGFLVALPEGLLHIRFDDMNSNDPAFGAHREIYAAMTESLMMAQAARARPPPPSERCVE